MKESTEENSSLSRMRVEEDVAVLLVCSASIFSLTCFTREFGTEQLNLSIRWLCETLL